MKNYKSILLTFPILILAWGCYTTSQHPLVHFEDDEGDLNLFSITVYDECMDCHDAEALEEYKSVHKPMMAAIKNYNLDYYEGETELEDYYNDNPWWFEYGFEIVSDNESSEEPVEIIVYRPEPPSSPIILYPPHPNPGPPSNPPPSNPPTTSPPKYRVPDNSAPDRSNSGTQQSTDPNPRNRDGGGRGNSSGRR